MIELESFSELRKRLLEGELRISDYCKKLIQEIGNHDQLNIFLEIFEDSALTKAAEIDAKASSGKLGKLAGMIISIKDNICYKNHKISASSHILEGFESLYSSTVVERLLEEDAIIIGRTNCDEFAMGSSNENSYFGNVKNPLNDKKTPGGSSGGAAASVAARMCHVALGSDTGGSIRQPASFTGTIGLKPTYGRVSRYGLIAYGSSLDQIGPIGNELEDIALVMEVIAGKDENDSTCSSSEPPSLNLKDLDASKKYKIAYLDSHLSHEGLHPDVKNGTESILEALKEDGHDVQTHPSLEYPQREERI